MLDTSKTNYYCSRFMTMPGGYCDQTATDGDECRDKYNSWVITAKAAGGEGHIQFKTTGRTKRLIFA